MCARKIALLGFLICGHPVLAKSNTFVPTTIPDSDPEIERKQVGRLQALRARRDSTAVEMSLAALRQSAAEERVNLMPELLDAARVHASEGEIVQALQAVWGDYREVPVF